MTESGRFQSKFQAIVALAVVLAAASIAIWFLSDATPFDDAFSQFKSGMNQEAIEAMLGPGNLDPPGELFQAIVGFRSVDSLPIGTAPATVRLWWYNGEDRYLYVDFAEGRLFRAALFGPSRLERRVGP